MKNALYRYTLIATATEKQLYSAMPRVKKKGLVLKVQIYGVRMAVAAVTILWTVAEMLIFPRMKYLGVSLEEYLGLSSEELSKV